MEKQTASRIVHRVTDLTRLKAGGAEVDCRPTFQIVPVDFLQREHPYRAFVFLCQFEGRIDGAAFAFRKCYARGCPHNLCPHVSQAVMIANRYLITDLKRLQEVGIQVETRLFSLADMIVKFEDIEEARLPVMTLEDLLNLAREGHPVAMRVALELIPAVEHFANYQQAQTFYSADFTATVLAQTSCYQRCLACFPSEDEAEKARQREVANSRLSVLYQQMDQAGMAFEMRWFD